MFALIAGTGQLPAAILGACQGPVLVCVLDGNTPDLPEDQDTVVFRLETLGSFISDLRARGVTSLCMAGAVRRPPLDPSRLDAATAPLVPRIMAALGQGDDGALRVVMALFEEAGITVVAAHDIAPDLLPPAGVLTRAGLPASAGADAVAGDAHLAEMGRKDSGQACVIAQGRLIAEEGADGTDAMLARLAPGADDAPHGTLSAILRGAADMVRGRSGTPLPAEGGILFKGPKPDQDRRADLPVIGPETASRAAHAGLAGIVIEEGGVMILELAQTLRVLDGHGMFLWVRKRGE